MLMMSREGSTVPPCLCHVTHAFLSGSWAVQMFSFHLLAILQYQKEENFRKPKTLPSALGSGKATLCSSEQNAVSLAP